MRLPVIFLCLVSLQLVPARAARQEIDSLVMLGSCPDDGNPCTRETGIPPNCSSDPIDGGFCNDGNVCTPDSRCIGGHCFGIGMISCDDNNPCTSDGCTSTTGCIHANSGGSCNDGNACTTGDACGDGVCSGTPVPTPLETTDVRVAADKATFSWSAAPNATRYDVLRGGTGTFPVGPGGGDETCFNDLAGTTLTDAAIPPPDAGFWYISRAENSCGNGTYGTQSNGTPRLSTTCP